jgi:hypothetical protein
MLTAGRFPPILGSHSLSVKVALRACPDATWCLTNVYVP